jgi:small subunit ribosomal protein S16
MPVRIRLRRVGRKKQPSYRIVVAESHTPRDGAYLDNVGFYNPRREPVELRVDLSKVDEWVGRGAELTPTVASLVRRIRRTETPAAE